MDWGGAWWCCDRVMRVEGGEGGVVKVSSGRGTDVVVDDKRPMPMGSATVRGTAVERGGTDVSPCACVEAEVVGV